MSSHQELRTTKDVKDSEGKHGTYPHDYFSWELKKKKKIPTDTDLCHKYQILEVKTTLRKPLQGVSRGIMA